jgi:indolepyruvate ferredoxin oxidoreductase beta subunit
MLIAALGGEGGGVLASWLHSAGIASGHFVQGTSIPGVAQRTGATTYYLEVVPDAGERHRTPGTRPVLALNAAPGEVDLVVASELLESTRAIGAGYVTPDRTVLIASSARVFTVDEKAAMGDGRLDQERMLGMAERFSRRAVIADFAGIAAQEKSPLNAVLLGAIAATGVLPIPAEAFRAAIRAEGKAVDANVRGFEAGLKRGSDPSRIPSPKIVNVEARGLAPELTAFPAEAHAVLAEGIKRLTDYQDRAYAWRYLARVNRFVGSPGADGAFLAELARHLAVRMSVEDVIRVAQLKLRKPGLRASRTRRKARAATSSTSRNTSSPVPEEIRPAAAAARALGARPRAPRSRLALKVTTMRLSGFLRLKALAGFRRWRPRTLRFAEEEAWVEHWLDVVERTLAVDPAAAREVVATAALVRGYADTYKRGLANWNAIMDGVVEPMLAGKLPRAQFADAVLQAASPPAGPGAQPRPSRHRRTPAPAKSMAVASQPARSPLARRQEVPASASSVMWRAAPRLPGRSAAPAHPRLRRAKPTAATPGCGCHRSHHRCPSVSRGRPRARAGAVARP